MTKILVIEDEPAIAENVTYALTTEGFSVEHCATGAAARVALEQSSFSLIVLDIGLPDMNGLDFCGEVRKNSKIPIIFLTARAQEVDRVVGLEIGGDDYVVKPFSPRELAARVRVVLRRTISQAKDEDMPAHISEIALFHVDPDRMKIFFRNQPLNLSRYEFKILETLIRRPGRVYTRQQLLHQAWDNDSPSLDRTIDTHIKTLRAKLKEIYPGDDSIETHRGFGYSLREPA